MVLNEAEQVALHTACSVEGPHFQTTHPSGWLWTTCVEYEGEKKGFEAVNQVQPHQSSLDIWAHLSDGISSTDCCLLCDESWLHRAQLSSHNTKDQSHQLHRNDMGVVKWAKHTTSAHWLGARATSKDFMRNANLMVNPTGIYRTQGSTISLVHSESLKAPSVHSPQHSLWQ